MKTLVHGHRAVLLAGLLVSACSSQTQITGSWKNPIQNSYAYKNIHVTALTGNERAKAVVEEDLAEELREQGVEVSTGMEVFPSRFTEEVPDRDKMLAEIRNTDADAILTVALVDKETESRYVPGSYDYSPFPRYSYYGRFWGYYSYWQPQIYQPGYYSETKIYYIETNLYDVNTEQLIWSAQSETYNPGGLEEFSDDFAELIAQRLRQEKVLK